MARRPSAKKKFSTDIEDLNLVPIMNLVVCLIPMVLFGASFVQLGVVNVNTPKFGMGKSEAVESDEKPLNLTIAIAEDGFRLSASVIIPGITGPEGMDPTQPPPPPDPAAQQAPTIPKKGENYDFVELYNTMVRVKDMHPNENIVTLTADSKIQFQYIIKSMDVLRLRLDANRYNDLAAFQSAKPKTTDSQQELLWPDVVLSVAQ